MSIWWLPDGTVLYTWGPEFGPAVAVGMTVLADREWWPFYGPIRREHQENQTARVVGDGIALVNRG